MRVGPPRKDAALGLCGSPPPGTRFPGAPRAASGIRLVGAESSGGGRLLVLGRWRAFRVRFSPGASEAFLAWGPSMVRPQTAPRLAATLPAALVWTPDSVPARARLGLLPLLCAGAPASLLSAQPVDSGHGRGSDSSLPLCPSASPRSFAGAGSSSTTGG